MCLSIPGRIISITDDLAEVDIEGAVTKANISLLEEAVVGDYVLVHTGFAIERYSTEEGEETIKIIKEALEKNK